MKVSGVVDGCIDHRMIWLVSFSLKRDIVINVAPFNVITIDKSLSPSPAASGTATLSTAADKPKTGVNSRAREATPNEDVSYQER